MFENYKVYEIEYGGKKMTFETGKMCCLSNASVLVRWGETVVLVNVTASAKPREGIDFFPLSVDFEEKLYAVGKIPGSFIKRESRPSDKAILSSRLVDRPIRPLFPKDMRNDCSVVMTVMSVDPDCLPEIAGMVGTSFALSISDIPWNGPIAGINVGLIDGEIVVSPDAAQRAKSDLNLTVAANEDVICMIEAGANEVSNDVMLDAIIKGHEEIKRMVAFIKDVQAEIGKPKFSFQSMEVPHELFDAIKDFAIDDVKAALDTDNKNVRDERLAPVVERIHEKFDDEEKTNAAVIDEAIYKLQKFIVRRWLLDEQKRVDGRKMDEIRPLAAQVGLLPRVHGSGMFTRGQTQVLTIATLGTVSEAQKLDGIDDQEQKRYIHHYNFPSYSVGETRPSRGPGRREIGHGALAERALEPVIPPVEEFPYTIRLVSEVLSSNGSTSQGSICGSTLALMDAGVPIKRPVAGISCGLITEDDRWMTMVDIQGLEDFFGDMDFKVGGTEKGITAIQMDLKIVGLTYDIIREAFEKTYKARMYILNDIMLPVIPAPREELSKYAPKMKSIKIHPDKIREVIGSGGKVIQKICADCNVKIDINDDGDVFVAGTDSDGVRRALSIIETIVNDPEIGAIYKGRVTRLMNFGAFVELAPGKEGMVHISKLDMGRVEKVEDVVAVGDEVIVKVTDIDQQGRINLSRRDALIAMEAKKNAAKQ
ncbi:MULTISPECIES: polyribonucleotide nucleotidyltransferase [Anaerotruncus]|uniref:Polyribonucleotide nucleotidyltransferase n=1 Tax=Anaerotruncus colihominis TaxID=169435 RepID=A0A845SSY1_9FIRM|nr:MULTISPECIES: polyribonucleotide nucleotidyltransferase [Anaerotruncus]MCI8493346.1 polyribonucleotide nucleotidyltransferase [Anaerotruncus sp.]MCR2026806.1 polyribonucleotide nucleotidyltransferase [Anaerotruncus colihominis]NBI78539.1 polyribonucleotide nucleotidyltransferase [Anaerotruncus colihominis]NDO37683.1 polyribonucleotide nucleotidyltransferase [Anaerotruncus colihominis]